jgi:ferredoxin
MKIRVIEGKCSGHARCAAVAPEIFLLNDDGYLEIAETNIPADQEGLARRGARACPERAIEIVED